MFYLSDPIIFSQSWGRSVCKPVLPWELHLEPTVGSSSANTGHYIICEAYIYIYRTTGEGPIAAIARYIDSSELIGFPCQSWVNLSRIWRDYNPDRAWGLQRPKEKDAGDWANVDDPFDKAIVNLRPWPIACQQNDFSFSQEMPWVTCLSIDLCFTQAVDQDALGSAGFTADRAGMPPLSPMRAIAYGALPCALPIATRMKLARGLILEQLFAKDSVMSNWMVSLAVDLWPGGAVGTRDDVLQCGRSAFGGAA